LVTSGGLLGQRTRNHSIECYGNLTRGDRRWLVLLYRGNDFSPRLSFERPLARQHLIEHDTQTEDIGATIDFFAAHLFW
jgi:hypothetical protein